MKNYEVKFSGLSWNPSEHETADGTLCAMVNLVAGDKALQHGNRPQAIHKSVMKTCSMTSTSPKIHPSSRR